MLVLTILGSLGGFLIIWEAMKFVWIRITRFRMYLRSEEKDYSYIELEMGDRILKPNKHILQRRKMKIKALQHRVKIIKFGFGPISVADIDVRIISGKGKLLPVKQNHPIGDWLIYELLLDNPLNKRQTVDFILEAEYVAKESQNIPNNHYYVPNRLIENLTLRVIFPFQISTKINLQRIDKIGNILSEKFTEADGLSFEANWKIPFPKPGITHIIDWNTPAISEVTVLNPDEKNFKSLLSS